MMSLVRFACSSFAGLLTAALASSNARASEAIPSRLYDITIETGMPHLEENLRYATTHEQRCLSHRELIFVFPALSHESLKGCTPGEERRQDNTSSWTLICKSEHGATGGTTGHALWFLDASRITGTLNIRLGGKNMTFYQRVTLSPLGECREVLSRHSS